MVVDYVSPRTRINVLRDKIGLLEKSSWASKLYKSRAKTREHATIQQRLLKGLGGYVYHCGKSGGKEVERGK